ncbi:1-phosphatidylinositol-3-phosphate 5-kinase FAB1B-like isoform X1 [Iris pallida]|uniref:1-phosphatidylinositol-3-phosphate 5-kinase n=1 Tax=Iris pallida TaxID=29817 RepID=A0AAX6I4T7_IRIPA|nr:1-phosphatidylinositol-3-phosphate 5-kinase FAB1B-like isoform X1 [Iris pallida]
MEPHDSTFSEYVDIVKSLIPRRPVPSAVSRDYWMPDNSCRVCYECDNPFTIFYRKHHCRLCGRVFCAKCTSNSIPVSPDDPKYVREDGGRIRVCNYCFKGWQREIAADSDMQLTSPVLSPSSSTTDFASMRSSGTGESSNTSACPVSHSSGAYPPNQSILMESRHDEQNMLTSNMDSVVDIGDPSPNEYAYCMNRSDDEDDEYSALRSDSDLHHFQTSDEYYGPVEFEEIDQSYGSNKGYPAEENTNPSISSQVQDNTEFRASLDAGKIPGPGNDNSYGCDASSTIYGNESSDTELVDFESNRVLWLPPEPEDEEDEREPALCDDDDDEDATGEWGYMRSSNSFGSGEYRSRDRSNEEHKKVIKNVVDGHFRALVAQLLQVENLPMGSEDDKESWLEIITTLSWEAATLLKPDTSKGGRMDPGGYVKVKCIACGRRSESVVVRGVVCKKNVAHRRMSARIDKPRFLILGGALEYQRVTNTLSSVDTLLQQETDHLKMAVAKIDAHHPNVLLVEKSVSRFAQDCLLAKNISLVLNIKRPLLERIARCTGAQIVPSVDHLSSQKLGHCDLFHVEKFNEEHDSTGQGERKMTKTLMFFEGCPKPLGCTVLLRGANSDELKKVKHVVQYGVFAAYHLALETSFLADEGASLPELPLKSPITVAIPDSDPSSMPQYGDINGFTMGKDQQGEHVTGLSSTCPRNEERGNFESCRGLANDTDIENQSTERRHDSSNMGISHQDNVQSDEIALSKEDFTPPSDHQSILVSSSSRCVRKGTVCDRAHLLRIKYYGSFDKPLGRFLRDHLFDQSHLCHSCEMPSEAHVHCYTHQQGSLTISVRKLSDFLLPGERDGKIWMWHRCLRCPRINGFPPATRRVVMSDAAWGLSFGKFLELSFSNNAAASRVASCGHSLHRDCLRFYGFGRMVACFRYAPVNLNSVCLPPSKLDFNYQHQEWILKEADEVAKKAKLLFYEILDKMHEIAEKMPNNDPKGNFKVPEANCNMIELEDMLQKEKTEFEDQLRKVVKKDATKGQPGIDILEINKLCRQLLFQSYFWDQRLKFAASGFTARCKAKLDSSDKLVDLNLTPKKLKGFLSLDALPPRLRSDEFLKGRVHAIDHQGGAPDHHTIVGQERNDLEQDCPATKQVNTSFSSPSSGDQLDPLDSGCVVHRVLSDAQFPIMADLSDTLDAKWTGENGPALSEASMLVSSASVDGTYSTSVLEESDERGGDVSRSLSSTLPTKLVYNAEDCSNWIAMPFSDLYCSFNKSTNNASKLDALNEYNPVYITLFRDLLHHNGARLLLPVGVNDIVIPVYDDEPTSIIAYALVSPDYHMQASHEQERVRESGDSLPMSVQDSGSYQPCQSVDSVSSESLRSIGSTDDSLLSMSNSRSSLILDPLSYNKPVNIRVSFSVDGPLGKVRHTVTCYYADRFEKLRKICCPSEVDFIRSLSRCKKWGAQGGKSNVFFAKTLDDRFIVKQVTKTELESFIQFGPEYFKYLTESISTGSPTCLAKILGIYQVSSKHLKGGKESRMDVLVMENLLFGRNVTKVYDLKGSARSRYNPDSSGNNKVLLDQNLIEAMPTSPIFVGNKAKRLLERAVWNDTAFLASIDVMDYSLLVGIDEEKHELVLGIIDFMRQYTWDKHLETWVKASGILGGPKNASPTVISPKQYKKRFRKAMSAYFLVVPDQWSPPAIIPSRSQSDLGEDNQQSPSVQS